MNTSDAICPVLGEKNALEWKKLDLSINNKVLYPPNGDFSFGRLSDYIDNQLQDKKIGYGGYMEHRGMYLNDDLFGGRNIHLGIDVWMPAQTPLFAALDGVVHSLAYNNNPLDYGHTLILTYRLRGENIHCLYGHLAANSMHGKREGMPVQRGTQIGAIGNIHENGGWKPHLHIQLIRNMNGYTGDFPGVCRAEEKEIYGRNCPDPSFLLFA